MSKADWDIHGPTDFVWTPAEVAQIARAAQAFEDALPNAGGRLVHTVTLNGLSVLDGRAVVTWPQPVDPPESEVAFGPVPCSVCGQPVRVDKAHTHSRGETMNSSSLRAARAAGP